MGGKAESATVFTSFEAHERMITQHKESQFRLVPCVKENWTPRLPNAFRKRPQSKLEHPGRSNPCQALCFNDHTWHFHWFHSIKHFLNLIFLSLKQLLFFDLDPFFNPLIMILRSTSVVTHRHLLILGSLSKDVFERRTSAGSEVFSLFICLDTTKFVLLSFFSPIKTIYLRVSTKLQPNVAKRPLPVDVRRSKTLLLKLPIDRISLSISTTAFVVVTNAVVVVVVFPDSLLILLLNMHFPSSHADVLYLLWNSAKWS